MIRRYDGGRNGGDRLVLMNLSVTAPYTVAEDTFLIPTFIDKWPPSILPVHSMVIRGAEPIITDTGCEGTRDGWLESVFSVVDVAPNRHAFARQRLVPAGAHALGRRRRVDEIARPAHYRGGVAMTTTLIRHPSS
jgi:hypothetical protein